MHSSYGDHEYRPPPPTPTTPTSGVAVASLIFGIIGFVGSWCLFGIPSLVAVVLGHVAARQTKRGMKGGHGMAVAGLVLGYLVIVPALVVSGFLLANPSTVAEWINQTLSGVRF
ncbi:DUF4190 domain-containing protein [[Actinomadura] parvosata]|uniref:DUF4190 domain-containing protein n=1 Tax=[Actinomadura] parvosata TaxID=1955412 RepID=UPI00406CF351